MKKFIFILISVLTATLTLNAQVGIGGLPSPKSILDLTNINHKYLILPKAAGDPSIILTDTASVLYYNDNIYMRTSQGIKVFTPWKWDGDSIHSISSPSTSSVGIGIEPPAGAQYLLQVSNSISDVTDTTNSASIIIGRKDSCHILIDNDEIIAKTDYNNAGTLKLQEEGGSVSIRSNTSDAGLNTVLTTYGSIDAKGKIKENNNELLPAGIIIIWSGTTIPAGWVLCDGGTYTKIDGSGPITAPNLIDRFIVGADIGGTGTNGTYAINSVGGSNTSNHTHTIGPLINTLPIGGEHSHTVASPAPLSPAYICLFAFFGADYSTCSQFHNHTISSDSSTHDHSFDLHEITSSNPSITENRPPYYALAFIMKL